MKKRHQLGGVTFSQSYCSSAAVGVSILTRGCSLWLGSAAAQELKISVSQLGVLDEEMGEKLIVLDCN